MSDLREVFPVLVDQVTDEGKALTAAAAGDAAAGKTGLVGFGFKDSSGNLVLPQLTSGGNLPIQVDDGGLNKSASSNGVVAGSLTVVTVAELTLVADKVYKAIKATGSCFREAIYDLVQLDDVTETIIGSFIVGPGQFSFNWIGQSKEITAGSTGTQKLILKAKNLQKASDFRGDISCIEVI